MSTRPDLGRPDFGAVTLEHAGVSATPGLLLEPGGPGGRAELAGARTPSVAATKRYSVKVHWPYRLTEAGFVAFQIA